MTHDTPRGSAGSRTAGVHVAITAPIATVEIVGPRDHDGLPTSVWRSLAVAVERLSADERVKCVVLLGVGITVAPTTARPAEHGAVDPAEAESVDSAEAQGLRAATIPTALRAIRGARPPTVALVRGSCTGWRLEIASCCDVRVAAESSHFGAAIDPALLTGVYDELRPLVQLLGPTPALDLVLDGRTLGADRALVLGLVTRVAPDVSLEEQAYGLAARIAAGAPLVNPWHKQAVRRVYGQLPLLL